MKAYTLTDIGKVRSENQDCVRFVSPAGANYNVLALCDGMGGAKSGGVASEIALNSFVGGVRMHITEMKKGDALEEVVLKAAEHANEQVYNCSLTDKKFEGMGTTLVAAVVKGTKCCILNVGDSRAYLISNGEITQITSDHSFVEDMVRRGSITREQARNHPRRNVITRALGVEQTVECDIFTPIFRKNDILLLCTDGLSNTLTDEEILEITEKNKVLSDIGKELLDLTLSRGAPDNVTVGLLQK
ncbi:MAG: Stp1/IreP family PP2C-type Ser/Thr phosphatase [Clostridiales bacterium]|jgi:serine/threonine protein phosphatase PrpC|nr:Stp1/IreP family PP2C-type Ser/Thr phosphatase [Clostridiales bacterium]